MGAPRKRRKRKTELPNAKRVIVAAQFSRLDDTTTDVLSPSLTVALE
jgi:hypothetical protein